MGQTVIMQVHASAALQCQVATDPAKVRNGVPSVATLLRVDKWLPGESKLRSSLSRYAPSGWQMAVGYRRKRRESAAAKPPLIPSFSSFCDNSVVIPTAGRDLPIPAYCQTQTFCRPQGGIVFIPLIAKPKRFADQREGSSSSRLLPNPNDLPTKGRDRLHPAYCQTQTFCRPKGGIVFILINYDPKRLSHLREGLLLKY